MSTEKGIKKRKEFFSKLREKVKEKLEGLKQRKKIMAFYDIPENFEKIESVAYELFANSEKKGGGKTQVGGDLFYDLLSVVEAAVFITVGTMVVLFGGFMYITGPCHANHGSWTGGPGGPNGHRGGDRKRKSTKKKARKKRKKRKTRKA